MKTLIRRLLSETPKFWKRFIWFGGVLTAVSATLLATPDLPEIVHTIAGCAGTAGLVIAAMAKATTTDQQLSKK